MMEVFAGFLTQNDYHYGRLFNFLKTIGQWENTLIMFAPTSGASSEGGPIWSIASRSLWRRAYGRSS